LKTAFSVENEDLATTTTTAAAATTTTHNTPDTELRPNFGSPYSVEKTVLEKGQPSEDPKHQILCLTFEEQQELFEKLGAR
jgi:hypothetical protein